MKLKEFNFQPRRTVVISDNRSVVDAITWNFSEEGKRYHEEQRRLRINCAFHIAVYLSVFAGVVLILLAVRP